MMRVRPSGSALLPLVLAAVTAAGTADAATPPPAASVDVRASETILTFPARATGTASEQPALGALVALPPDATTATATLMSGRAEAVTVSGPPWRLRGRAVVVVTVVEPGPETVTVAVRHDGSWAAKADDRLWSAGLLASLPGVPVAGQKAAGDPLGGSYVIITAPQYLDAVAPLADWKTRKGWPVVVVTTDVTGTTNAAIRGWLQSAYDTWTQPPEYVLLVGDVDRIPAWNFSGNVTDLPYALLDGDDWLPDLMLGRFSVANQTECNVMVAKTVHYEQSPYVDEPAWFTRGVMVAGQYASTTPMYTVEFCGEQLVSIGFDPLDPLTPAPGDQGNYIVSPYIPQEGIGIPLNMGPAAIKTAIDFGCSIVAYRGWAYGTAGWEPPHYTVNEIPSLANGQKLPVVMSFVCLNGDFSASEDCFGEVFTRAGGSEPAAFKGAVAFLGNGEHWSHTRHNDAMAISVFERIVDPSVTTLGALLNAGKLRFLEYFPSELEDTGDEESVEFYFHIYNLLGDPELNYHRAAPTALVATHAAALPAGTTLVEVTAQEAGGTTPRPGARIAIAQAGHLLGAAIAGADGSARVVLAQPVAAGAVDLTVSHADRVPYRAQLSGSTAAVFLGLVDLGIDDAAPAPGDGNGDGAANPGESLALSPTLRNAGTAASSAADLVLTVEGPATVSAGSVTLAGIAAGATGVPESPLVIDVAADASDGAVITGRLDAQRDAEHDLSGFTLVGAAPDLVITAATTGGDAWVEPGQTSDLVLTLRNLGSLGTAGGTLDLTLVPRDGVTLLTGTVPFGALPTGGEITAGPVQVVLTADVAAGAALTLLATANCDEGAQVATSLPIAIGRGAASEPSGPDDYGYYAYDSADYLYPDQRPVYHWTEISTTFGGPGTKLPFASDNNDRDVAVDLPFTFRFYGLDYARVRVSDNGWLSFEDANDDYNFYNWPIPSADGNGALVAPFWDNLTPEPAANPDADPVGRDSDGVYWYHDAARDEVVFEWSQMRHYLAGNVNDVEPGITNLFTFQAVLRNPATHPTPTGDGEILYYYKQVADTDYLRMFATVGIESPDETDGLQLTYDAIRSAGTLVLGPGQAIRVTTAPPVRVPFTVSSLARADGHQGVELSWTVADPRPVAGWRVYAVRGGDRQCLTPTPLAAGVRAWRRETVGDADLVLEALLPHGAVCEAGKALAGTTATAFALGQPVPNPVRGEASIAFAVPRTGEARLRIFDVRGRCVRTLLDGPVGAGAGLVGWQGADDRGRPLADGVYFYRLEHAGRTLTRKLLLVR